MSAQNEEEGLTLQMREVLGQLFVHGPTWDGNLVSKDGRDDLIHDGFAARSIYGWNYLMGEGVLRALALDTRMFKGGDEALHKKWHAKQHHDG